MEEYPTESLPEAAAPASTRRTPIDTANIVVTQNRPIPMRNACRTGGAADFLKSLSPGDSFEVSPDRVSSWRATASAAKVKILVRKIDDKTSCIWRCDPT